MKKWISLLMCFLLFAGCTSVQNNDDISVKSTDLTILSPSGAPALSVLSCFDTQADKITVVEGADVLQAAFVNPNPEYDVIVAPTNLGVKLALTGKSPYRLAAVVTWGNLYVLAENEEILKQEHLRFAAFGQQAVPGLVFESVKQDLGISEAVYYNAVTEAQAALLSKNADAVLIAEPAATATIAKAKEKGITLSVVADIQKLWENKTGSYGYPQAGIFVIETEDNSSALNDLLNQIRTSMDSTFDLVSKGNIDDLSTSIENAGVKTLGVPSAQIVVKSYLKMGLDYQDASECEKQLIDFLSLFGIEYDSSKVLRQAK